MLNRSISRALHVVSLVAMACTLAASSISASSQESGQEAEARRHFEAGQRAQAAGSYDAAVGEYLKVVAILPQAAEAYASLGLAYNAEDKFAESARALEKAEKLKPGLKGVSLYLGIDYVKLNETAAATRQLREAARLEPGNVQAWLWLGSAWLDAGHTAEGIDCLRRANALSPSDPPILFRLGEAYRSAADSGTERVLTAASGRPLVHQVYGDIYKDERLWTKAAGHYHQALAEDSKWAGAHLGLGEVALQQGKLDEAAQELRLELEVDPRSAAAEALLAEAALLNGDPKHALELLGQAMAISPWQAAYALGLPAEKSEVAVESGREPLRSCRQALAETAPSMGRSLALAFVDQRLGDDAYVSNWKEFERTAAQPGTNGYKAALDHFYRGDLTAAEANLRAWLKTKPGDLEASYLLARTYRRLSLATLGRLLAVAPESYPAHTLLAETYENAEKYEKAIAEYRTAEQMAPDLPGIHYALGHLMVKTGDPGQAMDEFNEELRLNPNSAPANAELGALFVERSEQEKGIALLRKALALEPDVWVAHRELGRAYYKQKNFAMAEGELQKAVEHDPDGSAHYQLGLVYRALGRPEEARKMLADSRQIQADQLVDQNSARALPEGAQP